MAERETSDRWLLPAALAVAALTALRLALLPFNVTDLHPLEAEAWAWSMTPAAAPVPQAAWGLAALGWLSDAAWVIRLPAPLLHGVTALILGAAADRLFGTRMALATALTYATLPGVALGSLMLTPATIAAPFAAAAFTLYLRLLDGQSRGIAVAVGALLGLAVMAHPGAGLLALCAVPAGLRFGEARPRNGNLALILSGLIAVLMTAALLRLLGGGPLWPGMPMPATVPDLAGFGWYWVWCVAVPGPFLLLGGILATARWRRLPPPDAFLLIFALPPLFLGALVAPTGFGGGWGLAAVIAGLPFALSHLRALPRLIWIAAAATNLAATILLPLAVLAPDRARLGPVALMAPLTGRSEQSQTILDIARDLRVAAIVVGDADLLADLTYAARDNGPDIFATPDLRGRLAAARRFSPGVQDVLLVLPKTVAPPCPQEVMDLADITTETGAYRTRPQMLYLIPGQCLGPTP